MDKINTKPSKVSVVIQKISSAAPGADSGSFVLDNNSSNNNFSVALSRFNKVRKLQRKIKKLLGIRMVDQTLLLASSQRQLLPSETIASLLGPLPSTDQQELKLYLLVGCNAEGKKVVRATDESEKFCHHQQKKKERKSLQPSKELVAPAAAAPIATPSIDSIDTVANKEGLQSHLFSTLDNPNDNTITTILKLSFQDVHRRVSFEHQRDEASFAKLADLCTLFFGVKNVHRMVISYRDDDGDDVQLSTDAELAYALRHFADASPAAHPQIPLLKLAFDVKPAASGFLKKSPAAISNEATAQQQQQSDEAIGETVASEATPLPPRPSSSIEAKDDHAASSVPRRSNSLVKDGDVIVLQQKRPNGTIVQLAFSHKDNKIIAARQKNADDKVRKNTQWIVEKVDAKKNKNKKDGDNNGQEEEQEEVFFLSCKSLAEKATKEAAGEKGRKANLRVLPSGRVDHSGGRGAWARFAIIVAKPNQDGTKPIVSLRSVGRSIRQQEDNFVGIVFDHKKQAFAVVGDLKKDAAKGDAMFEMINFVESP